MFLKMLFATVLGQVTRKLFFSYVKLRFTQFFEAAVVLGLLLLSIFYVISVIYVFSKMPIWTIILFSTALVGIFLIWNFAFQLVLSMVLFFIVLPEACIRYTKKAICVIGKSCKALLRYTFLLAKKALLYTRRRLFANTKIVIAMKSLIVRCYIFLKTKRPRSCTDTTSNQLVNKFIAAAVLYVGSVFVFFLVWIASLFVKLDYFMPRLSARWLARETPQTYSVYFFKSRKLSISETLPVDLDVDITDGSRMHVLAQKSSELDRRFFTFPAERGFFFKTLRIRRSELVLDYVFWRVSVKRAVFLKLCRQILG